MLKWTMGKYWPIVLVIIFSPWIDTLLFNPIIALVGVSTSVILFAYVNGVDRNSKIRYKIVIGLSFALLTFLQIQTTQPDNLLEIANDDIRYRDEKLKAYPPIGVPIGDKTLWIPLAHWFEGRREYLVYSRIEQNLYENLDIGNFFFGGSPRPRVGVDEFEKFLYIYLPFGIYGLYVLARDKWKLLALTTVPFLALLAMIGNHNTLGPFVLLPIISCAIATGLKPLFERNRRPFLYTLIVLSVLVYIQVYSYENY